MISPNNMIKITRPLLNNKPYIKLSLNSIQNRNALSSELMQDFSYALKEIKQDKDIHGVVINS